MKDAKGHGSNPRGAHSVGTQMVGVMPLLKASASGSLGTHVTQFPSGKFGFVGSVPDELAYESSKPEYIKTAKQFGAGFVSVAPGDVFRRRTYGSATEAQGALDDYNKRNPK